MTDEQAHPQSFSAVNERLKDIADAVSDENMPLDDALDLFEEAVGLGMRASSLLEQNLDAASGSAEGADA